MTSYNSPNLVVLWPETSPAVSNIGGELTARFPMEQHSVFLPTELAAATGAEIRGGHFHSLTGLPVRLFEWRDPLEEHDLLMLTCNQHFYGNVTQECRDILNVVSPSVLDRVITFAGQHNPQISGPQIRVSIASARESDIAVLDGHLELFGDGHLNGPPGVLLGVATEFDLAAFCIVVEFGLDSVFVSPAVMNKMLLTFEKLTGIDLDRGQLSDQAIRMQKHIKSLTSKNAIQQSVDDRKGNNLKSPESPDNKPRNDANISLIEILFAQAKEDSGKARILKAALDRLGLYRRYENKFLDLFSVPKTQ